MLWKRKSRKTAFKCPFYTIYHDRVAIPNKREIDYYLLAIPDSVMVVAETAKKEIVFVRQYRYTADDFSLELPAGGCGGLKPLAAAKKELLEETGIKAKNWEKLGKFMPWNGVNQEWCHVFLATELTFGKASPEETEQIEVKRIPLKNMSKLIQSGSISDGMSLAVFTMFKYRKNDKK